MKSLSFIAVMQMISLQPPGEKGVQVELHLLQAVCSGDVILKCSQRASLDQYQEQPHFIDSHLDGLLTKIINIIREEVLDYEVKHVAFRCLYFISKVRGYKVVARHLPHETADLEPLLHYLENQDPGVQLKWETHYGLLLWLSIVKYLAGTTKAQDMAFYVLAIYLTRPDVKDSYLPGFINWAHEVLTKDTAQFKKGVLSTLAGVFKHGQREQMMEHAHAVLRTILTIKFPPSELLIQFDILETSSCLLEIPAGQQIISCQSATEPTRETKAAISVNDEDDHDYDVKKYLTRSCKPSETRTVLCSKRHWAADQSLIKELCRPARHGLLLPQRLSSVLPFMEQAMLYDELRGNFSVGSAVRDAACYLCWALARSYDPSLLQPFVHQLAKALVITTVLFVAQYEKYRPHLIQHLVDRKVIHWDTVIRQLTSQALHQMTFLDPESMKLILSTQILPRCTNPELYLRHGSSILASGKVISALCQVAKDHQRRLPEELGDAVMESITQTCIDILEERFWRSFGGDPMRIAVCHFIQDLSSGGFPLLDAVVDRWLKALRECLASADSNVQQSAISAVTALIGDYFRHQPVEKLTALLNHFLPEVTSNNQQARVGNALALGSMPRFLLTTADLEPLLHYLENQDPGVQLKWETHYGLLLWFSIVVKIPFHLQRFDTSTSEPIMEEF
ncbi:hypothetical protein DAPPUDRAFT_254224 [Daphnia pulex]|uniref:Tubulin-folding cofactor D ARM repeats domain-containing protein n=1 Tax=Daphnia pulex TaxID=6669 RepID=E9H6K8_DAPPU|nr:hypothetical protein DAPPUDRAFT_254224 [Daphnia pulex]|eukprot:EFX72682.1 hypothetical protein DAPPUDRAFT_254224 [Daphnia pulex]